MKNLTIKQLFLATITSCCLTSLIYSIDLDDALAGLSDSERSFILFRRAISTDNFNDLENLIAATGKDAIENSRFGLAEITPLHEAALEGKVWAIERLVGANVNIDIPGRLSTTPLEIAIRHHKTTAALRLIELGANRANMLALTDDPLIRAALES
jgi:hypothetical protein